MAGEVFAHMIIPPLRMSKDLELPCDAAYSATAFKPAETMSVCYEIEMIARRLCLRWDIQRAQAALMRQKCDDG